ncbi:hypothetical protein ACHAXS_001028 [Conticribra weissflogii]
MPSGPGPSSPSSRTCWLCTAPGGSARSWWRSGRGILSSSFGGNRSTLSWRAACPS